MFLKRFSNIHRSNLDVFNKRLKRPTYTF